MRAASGTPRQADRPTLCPRHCLAETLPRQWDALAFWELRESVRGDPRLCWLATFPAHQENIASLQQVVAGPASATLMNPDTHLRFPHHCFQRSRDLVRRGRRGERGNWHLADNGQAHCVVGLNGHDAVVRTAPDMNGDPIDRRFAGDSAARGTRRPRPSRAEVTTASMNLSPPGDKPVPVPPAQLPMVTIIPLGPTSPLSS
jgi:hypothetical protein